MLSEFETQLRLDVNLKVLPEEHHAHEATKLIQLYRKKETYARNCGISQCNSFSAG